MRLELDRTDQEILSQILRREVGETRAEVRRTFTWEVRDELKERQRRILGMIERLDRAADLEREPPRA